MQQGEQIHRPVFFHPLKNEPILLTEEQQAAYAEQQRVAAEKADEALRSKQEAASTMSAMQATYDSLSAEAAELLEQERAAQAAADAAQAQAVVEASARQAQENANASGNVAPGNDPSPSPSPAPSEPSGPSYNPVTGNAIVEPGVRLHRIAIFVGWGRTELVRLLRPGKLCRDWKLLPMGNHEHVHGHVAGR